MLQVILFGVVGFLIFSVFQTVHRGKVTPEERKSNPTLLEKLKVETEELNKRVSEKHAEEKFKAEFCQWFGMFEDAILSALIKSEKKVILDRKLEADPRYAEIYYKVVKERDFSNRGNSIDEIIPYEVQNWMIRGQPSMPHITKDPKMVQLFEEFVARHEEFVSQIKQKIVADPRLKVVFEEEMTNRKMKIIYHKYFEK